MKPLQIVFMGDREVGKTSLIHQFMYGVFTERTSATLGQSYHETVRLPNGLHKMVEILDTTGLQEFPAMREMYIQKSNHFVVVYSVECPNSFSTAQNLCNEIRRIKGIHFSNILLVGNKMDKGSSRKVSTNFAFQTAALEMNIGFLETSAYLNLNVNSIFHSILQNCADGTVVPKIQGKRRLRIHSDSELRVSKSKFETNKSVQKVISKSALTLTKLSEKELAMDPARKQVVRRYVCDFYPEFKPEDSWRVSSPNKRVTEAKRQETEEGQCQACDAHCTRE
ncbi:ras-related protein Rap-1b-like protein [Saccostrea cucullata]|uniref:ras-related protein Rap-1b-like protein n=1 Tax=Saccostrea cuccullata TaxID=36930 RepID=UPI002ED63480